MSRLRLILAATALASQGLALAWAANLPIPVDLVQLLAVQGAVLVGLAAMPPCARCRRVERFHARLRAAVAAAHTERLRQGLRCP